MPKPTTHTDVLVPRPDADDPANVHITLSSAFETGAIEARIVEVKQPSGPEVSGVTTIAQAYAGPSSDVLRITAEISATSLSGAELEMRGSPTQGSILQLGTAATSIAVRFNSVEVRLVLTGLLGAAALTPKQTVGVPGERQNQIEFHTDSGVIAATMTVTFE